jgi:DnaJ-like protein
MKWLLSLYPRAWRRRYGDEFLAVLEESRLTPSLLIDCLRGALDARLRPQVAEADEAPRTAAERPPEPQPLAPSVAAPAPVGPALDRRRAPRVATGEWETVIDAIIREAQERGEFDNLPGAGKPLKLDNNPYADEWALAYSVVKGAGFTLPWIALGQEIDAEREALRALLDSSADRLRRLRVQARTAAELAAYEAERTRQRERYLGAAAALDQKLAAFNHQAPTWRLDRGRFPRHIAAGRFDAACPPSGPADG